MFLLLLLNALDQIVNCFSLQSPRMLKLEIEEVKRYLCTHTISARKLAKLLDWHGDGQIKRADLRMLFEKVTMVIDLFFHFTFLFLRFHIKLVIPKPQISEVAVFQEIQNHCTFI